MANRHLIGKQIIQVEVNSSDKIYAIQQKVSDVVWKDLLPILNTMFDKIVGEDEVVSLDRIELDIGHIQLDTKSQIEQMIDRIAELLEKKINEKLRDISFDKNSFRVKNKNQNEDGSNAKGDHYQSKPKHDKREYTKGRLNTKQEDINKRHKIEKNNRQSLRRYYFDLWLHWLENGRLPSYAIQPKEDWMPLVLETLGLDIDAVTLVESKLKKYPMALKRLVLQHTNQDLKSITELYTGFSQTRLLDLCKEIKVLFDLVGAKHKLENYRTIEINIWHRIFELVILQRKKIDSFELGIEAIKVPSVLSFLNGIDIKKQIKTLSIDQDSFLSHILQQEPLTSLKEKETSLLKDDDDVDELKEDQLDDALLLYAEELLESPQFFSNAGVVLLHPFLSTFFKKLGLLEENDFIDFNARSKAIILLHFLATGQENPKEYEMVLPKFLCEMPTNIPVDHTIQLTKEEKEEANNLLKAVIEHWGVLGGTSPDGLREGFLEREGKLEKQQTGWRLLIEHKTLDILLDRLPWNLSLIKLPWMTEMLKVEWR